MPQSNITNVEGRLFCDAQKMTIDDLIAVAFEAGQVVPIPLERNGIIIGGLLVIQGEATYERLKTHFAGPRLCPAPAGPVAAATQTPTP
jgi:hypothetical protein